MKPQNNKQADYLDILYQNRNKMYGGYALRKNHHKRMNKALLMMLLICGAFVAMSMIPEKAPVQEKNRVEVIADITDIKPPVMPPITPPPPPPPPPPAPPTEAFTPPVIVQDTVAIAAPIDMDSLEGRDIGPVTTEGDPNAVAGAGTTENGTGTKPVDPPPPPVIPDHLEVMPEFKGNIYAYIANEVKYPRMAVEAGITGKVYVQFVVTETGAIANAKVLRGIGAGCDEEALRVISGMPNWTPGTQNGIPAKVYFTLPIKFVLE